MKVPSNEDSKRTATRGARAAGSHLLAWTTLLIGIVSAAEPVSAQVSVEIFAGHFNPHAVADEARQHGYRLGYRLSDEFGLACSLGEVDLEKRLSGGDPELHYSVHLTDFSFQWHPGGKGYYLFAGPGHADVDVEIGLPGPDNDLTLSSSLLTVNAGLGYRRDFGEHLLLRFEGLARWFERDGGRSHKWGRYDGPDIEYSLGLGWRF